LLTSSDIVCSSMAMFRYPFLLSSFPNKRLDRVCATDALEIFRVPCHRSGATAGKTV
jgi:hypothetical protein